MKKSFLQFVRKTKTQPLRPTVPWIHEKNRKAIRFAIFLGGSGPSLSFGITPY